MSKPGGPSRRGPGDGAGGRSHPDLRADAPGRIPESLIDAAIDGELSEGIQHEIARALNYDPLRKQELVDTADAINALQMPIPTPDFTQRVLSIADRRRRFIPGSWRRHVRAGRLGIAATLLLSLVCVAAIQRAYPRFTTIAAHPTPVLDIQEAIECDTQALAQNMTCEVRTIRESVAPLAAIWKAPGRTDQHFEISLASGTSSVSLSGAPSIRSRAFSIDRGIQRRLRSDDQTVPGSLAAIQSPLRLLVANPSQSWVYTAGLTGATALSGESDRAGESELAELDVPALP